MFDIVVVSLSSPLLIGVYKDNILDYKIETTDKTSDVLPTLISNLFDEYDIEGLYFAKGPGSFMSIKIVYITLKTISITNNIPLFATDGFYFTDGFIKANKNRYFTKDNSGEILIKATDEPIETNFHLPNILDKSAFNDDIKPMYILGAI